jgi:ADP-heptose:LPS heptosyltransferase
MKTIAIIRTGGIGDVILSLVSLSVIKHNFPEAEITWIGRGSTLDLIRNVYPKINIVDIQSENTYRENFCLIRQNLKTIDLIIDLQRSARSFLLCAMLRSCYNFRYVTWNKYSISRTLYVIQSKLRGRSSTKFLFHKTLLSRRGAMAQCTLRGLSKLGISSDWTKEYFPDTKVNSGKEQQIAVCLGSLFRLKELPLNHVLEFIRYVIRKKTHYSIILLGTADKYEEGQKIKTHFGSSVSLRNLCGKTTLQEASLLLESSVCSLANDSALAHLSESAGTPVFMFFGPTHERFGYKPYLTKSISFSVSLGCRPCHKNGNTSCSFRDDKCRTGVIMSSLFPHLDTLIND